MFKLASSVALEVCAADRKWDDISIYHIHSDVYSPPTNRLPVYELINVKFTVKQIVWVMTIGRRS